MDINLARCRISSINLSQIPGHQVAICALFPPLNFLRLPIYLFIYYELYFHQGHSQGGVIRELRHLKIR